MSISSPKNLSFQRSFFFGWSLMTKSERLRGFALAVASTASGILDTVALASALPLVKLIMDPDFLTQNQAIAMVREAIGNPDYTTSVVLCAITTFTLMFLGFFVNVSMTYASSRYAASCWNRLARELLERMVATRYAWFLDQNSMMITRLLYYDIALWSRDFVLYLLNTFSDVFVLALLTALVLNASPLGGFVAIAIVAVLWSGAIVLMRPRVKYYSRLQREAADQIIIAANQVVTGIKEVKLSSREDSFVTYYSKANGRASYAFIWNGLWRRMPPLAILFLGQIGLVSIAIALWFSNASSTEITATVALAVLVSSRIIPTMNRLAGGIGQLWSVFPYVIGIHNVMESLKDSVEHADSSTKTAPPAHWNNISFDNVSYDYSGQRRPAIIDLSFTIRRGKIHALFGQSGAGKSTVANMILGLLEPTKGQVRIDGTPLAGINLRMWQHRIGYVPQTPFILSDTLRANVAFGIPRSEIDDARVLRCLRDANLETFVEQLDRDLDTNMGDRGARLSGGQQQRLTIARALYKNPDILVLDEATSALDAISEAEIQEVLMSLRGRVTVLLIAHRLATIRKSDTITLLNKGRLVAEGNFDTLLKSNSLFRQMVNIQRGDRDGTDEQSNNLVAEL